MTPSKSRACMRPAVLLLALSLALAGCSDGKPAKDDGGQPPITPPPPPPPDECLSEQPPAHCRPDPPANETPQRLELVDCATFFLVFETDTDKVQQNFPEGYQAAPVVANVGQASLSAYRCASAIIGNATVVQAVDLFFVPTAVQAPAEAADPTYGDLYILEFCTNQAQIQDFFVENGFPACDGTLEVNAATPSLSMRFSMEGTLSYEYTAAGRAEEDPNPFGGASRWHHADGDAMNWADETSESDGGQVAQTGALAAMGGAVSAVALNPGPVPILSAVGHSNIVLTFNSIPRNAE